MAKSKENNRSADRHKGSKQMRVREAFIGPLSDLAEKNATKPAEELNRAIRELLEREGLWPPKGEK